jgi:hypothetical protein
MQMLQIIVFVLEVLSIFESSGDVVCARPIEDVRVAIALAEVLLLCNGIVPSRCPRRWSCPDSLFSSWTTFVEFAAEMGSISVFEKGNKKF